MKADFAQNISFNGYKPLKKDNGKRVYEFNYLFDENKYDCYVEFYQTDVDRYNNYLIKKPLKDEYTGEFGVKINSSHPEKIDLSNRFGIKPDDNFAYNYKLYPKNTKDNPIYDIDRGNNIFENGIHYNIVTGKAPTLTKGGAMKLIVPDFNNAIWVYDNNNKIVKNPDYERAKNTSKNIANKIGGSLAGIEKDVESGKLDNFRRIVTTPLFTDDSLTAHAYWNKNNFQMAHSLGNINNYTSLQKKLFAKGINLVSDGALVNEGLEGIHFAHVLKWGEESPYFRWFRMETLKDSPLRLGVFGKNTNHITHRIVNSKYNFKIKKDGTIDITSNKAYISNKPTYIQIYDDRLVDASKSNNQKLIKAYDKLPESDLYINNHNDTVIPYSFRIDPETYKKNVQALSDYNKTSKDIEKINLYSAKGTKAVSQFEYFGLDGKHESGFETWDANPDIAKLNYLPSHTETYMMKNILNQDEKDEFKKIMTQKHAEAQDYAVASAKFWTKKTNDILRLHSAQNLKNIENKSAQEIYNIIKQKTGKIFPKDLDITPEIIQSVLKGRYDLKEGITNETYEDYILQGLMDLPLDSVEVGDDIASVLASPYITKRASRYEDVGQSRFEFFKTGNRYLSKEYANVYEYTDKMYTTEMKNFAASVLSDIENKLPADKQLHDKYGKPTPYGKYVIPFLTAEIARFAVIKSVSPKAEFTYDENTGEIKYNYDDLKNNTSLLKMGIIANCPEDEAKSLVRKLRNGIAKLNNSDKFKDDKKNFINALYTSIKDTGLNSFKLSEMIVSRAEAGLDWRIDATKDVADIEALRNGKMDFETTWDNIIKFWSKFTQQVKNYHPDAYIAAEVTDQAELYDSGYGSRSGARFRHITEAVNKLINEAGFTTTANYNYLSTDINKIFGRLFDYDGYSVEKSVFQEETVNNKLKEFLNSGSLESIIYSYTFAKNHDNCRALEGYAIDTSMVFDADLADKYNHKWDSYRLRAYKILNGIEYGIEPSMQDVNNYDYDRVSNLSVAKCEAIASGMGKAINIVLPDKQNKIYPLMIKALQNLSNGIHKGEAFEADGFGVKDFNTAIKIVFDEMDYISANKAQLSNDEKDILKKETLHQIIDPAASRLLAHLKFLVAMPGNPTLYAGDEYGSTGFEYKTKNITVQNRNKTNEEWADNPDNPEYMEFIHRFKNNIMDQFNLRKRPELQALNDGAPFLLNLQNGTDGSNNVKVSAVLRQSSNGKMALSLFNTAGLNHNNYEYYTPKTIKLDSVSFHFDDNQGVTSGLKGGMTPGTVFINAFDKNDKYVVREFNGEYFLKHIVNGNETPIVMNDCILILYSEPKNEPSFTGRRILYNPQYNIVSKPYVTKKEVITGSKLMLNAK